MAGAPFDLLEAIATPETFSAARELLNRQKEFAGAKANAGAVIQSPGRRLPAEAFRAWRAAVRTGQVPIALAEAPPGEFAGYVAAVAELSGAGLHLRETLERELNRARAALLESARKLLPRYLIFGAERVRELIPKLLAMDPVTVENLPSRKKSVRARERHLLLFLQRICAKNDTLSEFGPASWGRIGSPKNGSGVDFAPESGISKRECFLERWTAHGIAAAMNADRSVRPELSPRLHPNGRIEGSAFVFTETGERERLDPETLQILLRCDGATPAHSLGVELETLARLADQRMIRWEVEVPALNPHAFAVLVDDVKCWRDGPARMHWLATLESIAVLPVHFIQTSDTVDRVRIMDLARQRLQELGSARTTPNRFLYMASNPIGEECFRQSGFTIDEEFINEVAKDAAPWIDLWRDCYAFIAGRVADRLRALLEKAVPPGKALPLPAFLRHCESLNMPLTGPALVGFAHAAFQDVKNAFRERMKKHADRAEYELTADDCHFVRDNFRYDKFDEYTYPSADLQLAAESVEAIARGEYQWVLAELHPPVALLHHGFHWSCPDKPELSAALASTVFGKPNFHFGFYAADFTATTAVTLPDTLPELTYFVAAQRGAPHWRTISSSETEVYVDQTSGDVCLRRIGAQEYLGSFARAWLIPLGFHPFQFGMAPHVPRLRCGKIIVQRQAWVVREEELGAGDFTGVSRDLVLAIERLRGARNLPRYVYVRPTEQALRRSGAEGRDKDTKPVFVDLQSYLFLEIFHRWLTKWNELEVTEMLPPPDQLLWREPDGRRTFELRTLIVPHA